MTQFEGGELNKYECLVVVKYDSLIKAPKRGLAVRVTTVSTDEETIKENALREASLYLNDLGIKHTHDDLKFIGFNKLDALEETL